MLKESFIQSEIARVIEKDKSVISRELKRNSDLRSDKYDEDLAQRKVSK
jgi:transposase, IS30 family